MGTIEPRITLRLALEEVKRKTRRPFYELAMDVNLAESRLSKILAGYVEPSSEERARLARLIGRPEQELFDQSDSEMGRGQEGGA